MPITTDYGNYGLLTGIGNALSGGIDSYRTSEAIKRQKQQDSLNNALLLRKSGMQADPEGSGSYVPTEASSLADQVSSHQNQNELDSFDPTTPYSQQKQRYAKGILDAVQPGSSRAIPDDLPASELDTKGLLQDMVKGVYGSQGRQIVSARMGDRNEIMRESLEERRNQNAAHAGQAFEADPVIKGLKGQSISLDRGLQLLNGKTPINAKTFNAIQQDMINAIATGGAATEGKVNREMIDTLQQELNDAALKFGHVKDLRKEQPEVVNNIRQIMNGLKIEYRGAIDNQVKNVGSSYQDSTNPRTQSTVKRKMKDYSSEAPSPGLLQAQPVPSAHPQDSQAVEWAKNPNSKGWNKEDAAKILQLNGGQ